MGSPSLSQCFAEMERNLRFALEEDEKNKRENDAKMRAVSQRTSTYEEFRDIVKAAHLKPINKSDLERKGRSARIQYCVDNEKSQECTTPKSLADTCDFPGNWRKLNVPMRRAFLHELGPSSLKKEIGTGITTSLLGEVFEALSHFQDDNDELICTMELLQALTSVERFTIMICFLTPIENAACRKLFEKLSVCFVQKDKDLTELDKLKKLFLVL